MRPKIAICGPGRAGKDEAADFLVSRGWRYAGSTSVVISREIARREGISFEAAHALRHARRDDWFRVGNELRDQHGPAHLAVEVLKDGDLVVGVRSRGEIETAKRRGLVDLVVWIDRFGIPCDPTLEYGASVADVIIPNWGTLDEYRARLARLADLLKKTEARPAPAVADLYGTLGIPRPRGGDGARETNKADAGYTIHPFFRGPGEPPATSAVMAGGPDFTDPSPLSFAANVRS